MHINSLIFKELVRNGYSKRRGRSSWQITNPSLLFATEELARGFYNLKDFGVYRKQVIDREISLLKKNSETISKLVGTQSFNLIDMRCAGGKRALEFIKSADKSVKMRYCPAGTHSAITSAACDYVMGSKTKNVLSCVSRATSFERLVDMPATLRNASFQKNAILMLGSTLALFDINDFFFHLSKSIFENDVLIIGNGLRKGKRLVNLETYQDVSFNRWFMPLMAGLGFKLDEISYNARFGNSRIECFYTILTDKTISSGGKKISFRKGDEIIVAVIYKYYEKELRKMCKRYFSKFDFFKDDGEYALIICRK